jgi:hypothetical protein
MGVKESEIVHCVTSLNVGIVTTNIILQLNLVSWLYRLKYHVIHAKLSTVRV